MPFILPGDGPASRRAKRHGLIVVNERGIKTIGGTAHYATADLVRRDGNIERRVLARAVLLRLESGLLLNAEKTVVFRR